MKQNAEKIPKMTKEERVIFNLVNQIRTRVWDDIALNKYEAGFLNELTHQDRTKNKDRYKKTWNIKLHDTYANTDDDQTYFFLKGYGKHDEAKFTWIQEEVTKVHLDAMFNDKAPTVKVIFKSRKLRLSVDIENQRVELDTFFPSGAMIRRYVRPYELKELRLFKNIAEQMKG